jgi:acyl-CoA reductase-like NAD-dependent aldehyde dehydrogenase
MTAFALAAGNTVVAKPSEETPIIGLVLGSLFLEAGIPPGVFNIISGFGPDCGKILVEHPDINGIAFTGSTATGQRIAQVAAPQMKHLQLELGGKNPLIILKDFDVNKAVNYACAGAFQHAGQICMANTRIIAEEPIYTEFIEKFKAKVESLQLGDLRDRKTAYGPVINKAALNKIEKHLAEALASGAKLLTGGKVRSGLIFEPTVLLEPPREKGIWQEETFGPIVCVVSAKNFDEALAAANDTQYGLSAGVLTNDLQKGLLLARTINSGAVHIGTHSFQSDALAPVGGIGLSGIGKSGGKYSVDHFTRLRWVSVELGESPLPF